MARITHHSGTEGPYYDPYHYDEYTFTRTDGWSATIHLGLGISMEYEDGEEVKGSEQEIVRTFENFVGMPLNKVIRYSERIHNPRRCPRCGCRRMEHQRGYPGESFTICGSCDEILASHFHPSEIE